LFNCKSSAFGAFIIILGHRSGHQEIGKSACLPAGRDIRRETPIT
jgi:hypothetical protein